MAARRRTYPARAPRRPTQGDIARRAGVDTSTVNKVLHGRSKTRFSPSTIRKIHEIARALGYDLGQLKHGHRRDAARKETVFRAAIRLVFEDGKVYDEGTATLRNLSLSGTRATDLVFSRQAFPLRPLRAEIRAVEGPLSSVELSGPVIRVSYSSGVSLGIKFADLSSSAAERLRKVIGRVK